SQCKSGDISLAEQTVTHTTSKAPFSLQGLKMGSTSPGLKTINSPFALHLYSHHVQGNQ
ncbi:hypothetical protein KUCAC02_001798, partial [Chaenocephalus aceratus]